MKKKAIIIIWRNRKIKNSNERKYQYTMGCFICNQMHPLRCLLKRIKTINLTIFFFTSSFKFKHTLQSNCKRMINRAVDVSCLFLRITDGSIVVWLNDGFTNIFFSLDYEIDKPFNHGLIRIWGKWMNMLASKCRIGQTVLLKVMAIMQTDFTFWSHCAYYCVDKSER